MADDNLILADTKTVELSNVAHKEMVEQFHTEITELVLRRADIFVTSGMPWGLVVRSAINALANVAGALIHRRSQDPEARSEMASVAMEIVEIRSRTP